MFWYSTPANFSYFLDLIQARNIGNSGYNIRALGNVALRCSKNNSR